MSGKKGTGRTPARHMVAGVPMTVIEAAEMLGITRSALYKQRNIHRGASLEYIVHQYQTGWINKGVRGPEKHFVRGEWLTEQEAAEKYGGTRRGLNGWRKTHRQPDGQPGTLAAAVDAKTGVTAQGGRGPAPKIYQVNGRPMTLYDAARKIGCDPKQLYNAMYREHVSLAVAMQRVERRVRDRAVQDILEILNGGK